MWFKHKLARCEWLVYTTYKNGDDWWMVYDIVLTTLSHVELEWIEPPYQTGKFYMLVDSLTGVYPV